MRVHDSPWIGRWSIAGELPSSSSASTHLQLGQLKQSGQSALLKDTRHGGGSISRPCDYKASALTITPWLPIDNTNPVQLKKISKFLIIVKKLLENINRWKVCFVSFYDMGRLLLICDSIIYFLCDNSLSLYITLYILYYYDIITICWLLLEL